MESATTIMTMVRDERLKMLLLMLQTDYGGVSTRSIMGDGLLAITNERGRKKMLTKVSNLMFSPS